MFVLIWVILLFAGRSSNADTETTPKLNCSADGSPLHDDTAMAIFHVTECSEQGICTATHQNDKLMKEINVAVTYMKTRDNTGKIKECDNLNLTCKAECYLQKGNETDQQNNTGSDTLVRPTRQYNCTAQLLNTNVIESSSKNNSECKNQSVVLTCRCIIQGSSLPGSNTSNTSVVSGATTDIGNSPTNGDKNGEKKDYLDTIFGIVTNLETVTAFFIGIVLSSITCCLMRKCQRKKPRAKENLADTDGLEMVTCDADLLIYAGNAVEGNQAIDQEAAGTYEAAEAEGAMAAGKLDVEYSNLDFSLINDRQDATGETPGTTETEYAEIKKAMTGQHGEGIEEDEETGHCASVMEEEEDVALYSTVNDIMDDSFNEDGAG